MASTVSNKARFELANGRINFGTDVFKMILMDSGFTFNPDTHGGYADVAASELSSGNGYTTGGVTMTGVTITENNTTDLAEITWNNVTWSASGGTIGPTPGAIIYDDTPTTPQADTIIGYIDFGGEQTEPDGGVATVANPKVTV